MKWTVSFRALAFRVGAPLLAIAGTPSCGTGSGSPATQPPATIDAGPVADAAAPGDAGDGGRDFSSDRSGFFGDSRCAQAGLQICDGFEGATLDRTIWGVVGTLPVVDSAQHARGSKALHITQNGNGPSYIRELKTFPEPNDRYFGRIFVYFDSLPDAPLDYAHWTILGASGSGVLGEIRVGGQFQGGINLFGVGTDSLTDDAGTGDWTTSDDDPPGSPLPVPLNQWLCLEWMHDGSTNETRFYWDGVEHPSLHTTATMNGGNGNPFVLPQFSALWIGWQEYQTTTEVFDMWIDEVAIDTQRIGCVL